MYAQLLGLEQRLDSTITRKKLDLQEVLSKPLKVFPNRISWITANKYQTTRTLRVFLSNYASDQYTQLSASNQIVNPGSIPSWTLRVEGRLLDVRHCYLSISRFNRRRATRATRIQRWILPNSQRLSNPSLSSCSAILCCIRKETSSRCIVYTVY